MEKKLTRQPFFIMQIIFAATSLCGCARVGELHKGVVAHIIVFFVFFFSCAVIVMLNYHKQVKAERKRRQAALEESAALRGELDELKSVIEEKRKKEKHTSSDTLHVAEKVDFTEHELLLSREYIMLRVEKLSAGKAKRGTGYSCTSAFGDNDWKEVEWLVKRSYDDFATRMQTAFPDISIDDLRFCMLFKLGLTIKQVADLYGIAEPSVKHNAYLLKVKLGMGDSNLSLRKFLASF